MLCTRTPASGIHQEATRPRSDAPAGGIFGIHRYHHVAEDDARCVSAATLLPLLRLFKLSSKV
jgi:hypothetical protein